MLLRRCCLPFAGERAAFAPGRQAKIAVGFVPFVSAHSHTLVDMPG